MTNNKPNLKHYDDGKNTTSSLFTQLRGLIGKTDKQKVLEFVDSWREHSIMADKLPDRKLSRQYIVDVCEDIVNNTDEITRKVFIKNFSKIIHETGQYFTPLDKWQKGYYREYFVEKLKTKFFSHIENATTDPKALTHFKCLFTAFLRENVYKNKQSKYYEETPMY